MAKRGGDHARAGSTDAVAGDTVGGLYDVHPCLLAFDILRHVLVAMRTGELALVRNIQHRVPVDRRIILRSGRWEVPRPRVPVTILYMLGAVHQVLEDAKRYEDTDGGFGC